MGRSSRAPDFRRRIYRSVDNRCLGNRSVRRRIEAVWNENRAREERRDRDRHESLGPGRQRHGVSRPGPDNPRGGERMSKFRSLPRCRRRAPSARPAAGGRTSLRSRSPSSAAQRPPTAPSSTSSAATTSPRTPARRWTRSTATTCRPTAGRSWRACPTRRSSPRPSTTRRRTRSTSSAARPGRRTRSSSTT